MNSLTHQPLSPADFALFLGLAAAVPPPVRRALLTRAPSAYRGLADLRTPVLISHGLQDRLSLPATARGAAALLPQALVSLYPQVGHAPFWEDAPRFNRELRAFGRGLGRA